MAGTPRRDVRVLYVDDEASSGAAAASLERDGGLTVSVETGPTAALDRLTAERGRFDCVVSGPGLSASDGLELLRDVRELSRDLPFVMYTDDGSEDLASRAVSAGVTEYLPRREDADGFSRLADRVVDAVTRVRADHTHWDTEFERQRDLFEQTQRIARTGGWELDLVDDELRWTDETYRIYGLPLDYEPTVADALEFVHPEDAPALESAIERAGEDGESYDLEVRLLTADDDLRWVRARGEARREAGEIVALRGTFQDVTERRAREGDLRSTGSLLSTLVENIPSGILVEDDARRVLFTNPEFTELFGLDGSPDDLVGGDCAAAAAAVSDRFVDPERFLGTTDEAVEARATIRREELALADGRTFERSGTPVEFDGERTGYLWVYHDITERKRAENRFRELFENLPDPGVVVELTADDAVTRAVNGAFEDVFGYPAETAVGASLNDLIVPAEFRSESADLDRQTRSGEQLAAEVRRRTADGEVRDFLFRNVLIEDTDGDPRAHGIYTDITERKRRERRLNALHEATRELMAADTRAGMAEIASRATCDVLGLPLNGVHLYDEDADGLVPLAASTETREAVGELPTFQSGEGIAWDVFESGEARVYGDVRTDAAVYDPATPIRSELYLPLGSHGVLLIGSTAVDDFDEADVSLAKVLAANLQAALDRVGRERALREHERELQRQNERLDGFADVVAHDLRNPLNVAMAGLELVRETGETDRVETVARAHERMERIVEDVLTLARQGNTVQETRTVALEGIARRAWANVETGAATLRVDTDRTVDADPDRLERLFENLFRNSVEHGSTAPRSQAREDSVEHGSTDSRTQSDDPVEHGSTAPRSRTHEDGVEHGEEGVLVDVGWQTDPAGFYVEDTGPGIPPGEREHVFESGYTTAAEGTGFGLAIVEGIATAHGWEIAATEGTDGGARFEITTGPGGE